MRMLFYPTGASTVSEEHSDALLATYRGDRQRRDRDRRPVSGVATGPVNGTVNGGGETRSTRKLGPSFR